jgi:hypothetical protein
VTPDYARENFADCGPGGVYLIHLLEEWIKNHGDLVRAVTGAPNAWPVWDEVTVAHLLSFTSSATYPRPTLQNDLSFRHSASSSTQRDHVINWITQIDTPRLLQHFRESLIQRLQA